MTGSFTLLVNRETMFKFVELGVNDQFIESHTVVAIEEDGNGGYKISLRGANLPDPLPPRPEPVGKLTPPKPRPLSPLSAEATP